MYTPVPLAVQPGIYTEDTETLASNRWIDGNMVRFWKGQPERWGGWEAHVPGTLAEPARGGLAWTALDGSAFLAFGTASHLYVVYNGIVYDVTPIDFNAGFVVGAAPGGWGAGGWGGGTWGYAGVYSLYDGNGGRAMTWQLSTWGEDLIAQARGQKIWQLDVSAFQADRINTKAVAVTNSPAKSLGVFVHQGSRHLVALGSTDILANQDPLLVRWANQETTTEWSPAATNTAGSLRVDGGNEIVGSVEVTGGRLILTDLSAHFLRYIGGQFVFGLQGVSYSSGLVGPHAATEINGTAYWMSRDRFHLYNGRETPLPCDVHNHVFDDLNWEQAHMVYCATNRRFNEILWFYPSANSTEVDRCVAYNAIENHWSIHELGRSTWIDRSKAVEYPVATTPAGAILKHEIGTTDETGAEIPYRLVSGDLVPEQPEPSAGVTHLSLRKFVPDFKRATGTHSLTIKIRDYPHRGQITKGPYSYSQSTAAFPVRARGARFQLRFEGEGDFRMGLMKAYATRNGARQQ